MSKGLVLAGAVFAICAAGGFFGSQYISYHDKAVSYEANINKLSKSSESVLSNGTMMIIDKAKVNKNYAADFKDALRLSIGSRNKNDQGAIFNGRT